MASVDLKNNIKNLNAFTPSVINSDTLTNGVEVDTQGFESITFLLRASTYTDGTFTPYIEGSNTSGSAYNKVNDDFLVGTEGDASLSAAGETKIGVVASYRYYRLSFVSNFTSTGATLDAIALLGSARHNPVA